MTVAVWLKSTSSQCVRSSGQLQIRASLKTRKTSVEKLNMESKSASPKLHGKKHDVVQCYGMDTVRAF